MLVDLNNIVNLWIGFNVDFPIYGKGILVVLMTESFKLCNYRFGFWKVKIYKIIYANHFRSGQLMAFQYNWHLEHTFPVQTL